MPVEDTEEVIVGATNFFLRGSMERTMVQGGAFVFEGSETIFSHYDVSSGAHADLDELVRFLKLTDQPLSISG